MNFNFDYLIEKINHPLIDPDDLIFSRQDNNSQEFNLIEIPNFHNNLMLINEEKEKGFLSVLNPINVPNNEEEEKREKVNEAKERLTDTYFVELKNIQNEKTENVNSLKIYNNCKKEIFKNEAQIEKKSTNFSSEEKTNIETIIEKFNGKMQYRLDYLKKKYKVFLVKYAKNCINSLLKIEGLDKVLGTISLPNSKMFTGNVNDSVNYGFLQKSVKEIFILGKQLQNGGSLQRKNNVLIEKIFKRNGNSENEVKIKRFLNLSAENMIELFEGSKMFQQFSQDEQVIFLDYYFQKEKKGEYSLREKGGYVKLLKETFKKI